MAELSRDWVKNAAVRYLAGRAASRAQVRRALRRKIDREAFEVTAELSEWIRDVLDECERLGYLSDESFAANRVHAMRKRGASTRKIEMDLRAKGVSPEAAQATLEEEKAEAEAEAALAYAQRRRLGRDRDHWKRDLGRMARAGFSFSVAKRALTQMTEANSEESE